MAAPDFNTYYKELYSKKPCTSTKIAMQTNKTEEKPQKLLHISTTNLSLANKQKSLPGDRTVSSKNVLEK